MKIKIKKGDNVEVISGKDKGKQGIVLSIIKQKQQVIVENINVKTKHVKPKQTDEKGMIKKVEFPIHYSNIKIISKKVN